MPRAKKLAEEVVDKKEMETVEKAVEAEAKTKSRAKKTVAVKEETPAEKKNTVKKETKKAEPKAFVMIQIGNKEVAAKAVLAAAVEAYKAANGEVEVETIEIYIKPEENAVYYVVNGDDSGDNKIDLFQ